MKDKLRREEAKDKFKVIISPTLPKREWNESDEELRELIKSLQRKRSEVRSEEDEFPPAA